ncbi:MAG TPA: DUF481 domain-containing protein [Planctomycetota bacterium]|nr:DUF481 domain-containing protein [Planctomycetota bacterium]
MRGSWIVVALLGMSAAAWAEDQVKLKNGDVVTGKVTSLAGGKLVVETTYAGKVTIDWGQVVSVKSDAPIKVTLVTGEVLEGKVVPGQEGRLKVETLGAAAPVDVDLTRVKYFNQPPVQWHGKLTFAGKITDGNTDTKSFLATAEGTRESESDLFLLRAIFHYGQQEGVLTERNSYGIGKYESKFTPELYGYISEELSSDTFKDISLESITSVGAGYNVVKASWMDLSLEAGVAYFSTNFKVAPDDSHMGARVAANLRVALPFHLEFKDLFIIYPNFKDSQNYQFRNEASLGTSLGGGWDLLGGVITEYENKPSPGIRKMDDTYYLGFGYTF